ncbi:MAG: hypothetical protein EOO75_12140, partial [Myxococcales bacterium]
GSERLKIRLGLRNDTPEALDLKLDQMHGFFHSNKSDLVTPERGFDKPSGKLAWAGFDGGEWGFAWRLPDQPISYGLDISGFQYFVGSISKPIAPGEDHFFDHAELIAGGPYYDGLREAVRRVDNEAPWREVKGTVTEQGGGPVAGAYVHLTDAQGAYLSRSMSDAQGNYVIHAPPTGASQLVASKQGFTRQPPVAVGEGPVALTVGAAGRIEVTATDEATGEALPVRVQVIPATAPEADPPAAWGEERPADQRLHQEFAVTGQATLPVPAGSHRVVVSRGYEWELLDQTVTVTAGQTTAVTAKLRHSVDTTGVMCADFHIHSFQSADSHDPIVHKVKGAIADGLDIPVSSEHEWIVDFQPVIEQLGLQKWAFGMPSEELTTFTWGHFGVVPIRPRADRVNLGAVDWIGKEPPAFFKEVHAQDDKPLLIINHPSGDTAFSSYFKAAKLNRETATGNPKLWSNEFEAVEVFNDSDLEANRDGSLADWFALLNHGQKVWAVGSSDSHSIRTSPVGYPRSCIRFGHDDPQKLTPELVRDGTQSGNLVVSGGLSMTVKGPAGEAPGATLVVGDAETTLSVEVQ